MKSNKYSTLIDYLNEQYPKSITAKELGEIFSVTTRTIRNWISAINESNQDLIQSSSNGYTILPNPEINKLNIENSSIEVINERRVRILLELLKGAAKTQSVFDLADTYYISDSTLRNDIRKLEEKVTKNSGIKLYIEKDCIILKGSEKDKRKLMVTLLNSESSFNKALKKQLESGAENISVSQIEKDIQSVLNEFPEVRANQYVIRNIAIHIVVTIRRIIDNNLLNINSEELDISQLRNELILSSLITDKIADRYGIQFPQDEVTQLSLHFIGLNSKINFEDKNLIIEEEIKDKLKRIIKKTEELYLIDLQDEKFFNQLLIHIYHLLIRSKYNSYERNNSLIDIKIAYPIIYDISVYISDLIKDEFGIYIPEGEISFLSIHLGTFLENQESVKATAIRMLVVADDYQNIRKNMVHKLNKHLRNDVEIDSTFNLEKDKLENYDIVVNAGQTYELKSTKILNVNPILIQADLRKIDKKLKQINFFKQKSIINYYINEYLSEELFYSKMKLDEKEPDEIITLLSEKLVQNNLVEDNYVEKLLYRERMAPTSFPSGIALPHTVELDANETKIVIATLEKEIVWNEYQVQLIALTAISKDDAKEFNNFFQDLIEITSVPFNVNKLAQSRNYKEFVSILKMLMYESID